MNRTASSILILVCLLFPNFGQAAGGPTDFDSPLGISWGLHENQLRDAGVRITQTRVEGVLTAVIMEDLPHPLDDTDTVIGYVHPAYGLNRVVWKGRPIHEDLYGILGREAFDAFEVRLSRSFGDPMSSKTVGNEKFTEDDEFYECLGFGNCGIWMSLWQTPTGYVVLQLESKGSGTGQLVLTFDKRSLTDGTTAAEQAVSPKPSPQEGSATGESDS